MFVNVLSRAVFATLALGLAGAATAQVAGGAVGGGPAPYSPAGLAAPPTGVTPPIGSATTPPATGVTPPVGATTAGTIGDGRVGTLAPGASAPGVTGQTGTRTTTGITPTTPTTNPPPR